MSDIEIITFGCRLNAYESEVMRKHARDAGLGATVIVNTCAVTQESVRQARQAIRKARRENPHAKIVVTGCAAQIDPGRFAAMDEVDHVIGNGEKTEAQTFKGLGCGDTERVKVNDIMSVKETAGHLIDGFGAQARAYVQIQNGCDHRCTFCIIPYGRGPSRSVPAGEVVAQVRKLVENGYAEIVLTGVDITAYGGDLPGELTLGRLVTKILKLVPELKRLRLSSINSVEADDALLKAIAEEDRLMPHLHLSLQAGHDLTLKRMKRRHSRAHAVELLRGGAPASHRHGVRRRPHRRLSHRERGDVRRLDVADRRLWAHLPARLPVLGAAGHACRAHATAQRRGDREPRRASAREGCRGLAAPSCEREGPAYSGAHGERRTGARR